MANTRAAAVGGDGDDGAAMLFAGVDIVKCCGKFVSWVMILVE